MSGSSPGVSVVICCHNSAFLLPPTLLHLSRQVVGDNIRWEVLVIDNGSTDGTDRAALEAWPSDHTVPLRVVREPQLGLSHARARGVAEARYDVITFVDDDNWLCDRWIQTVHDVMRDRPDVGALGGIVEPTFEAQRPDWFEPVAYLYATGPAGEPSGDVTGVHMLCGAGLSVRKSALTDIRRKGFRPIAVGRQGAGLGAGEDSEMTYCLRLSSWRLWIDPCLRIRHFLPARRLQWTYARRLAYGSAFGTPERDALVYACKPPRSGISRQLRLVRERWLWQAGSAFLRVMVAWKGVMKRCFAGGGRDGDPDVLRAEFALGRFNGLVAMRRTYDARAHEIRHVMTNMKRSTRG